MVIRAPEAISTEEVAATLQDLLRAHTDHLEPRGLQDTGLPVFVAPEAVVPSEVQVAAAVVEAQDLEVQVAVAAAEVQEVSEVPVADVPLVEV